MNTCSTNIPLLKKVLTDSLIASGGQDVETMQLVSCKLNSCTLKENINEGLILIFEQESLSRIEHSLNVVEFISKLKNDNQSDIGIRIIYNIKFDDNRVLSLIKNFIEIALNIK